MGLADTLKKVLLAGIGAAALGVEKAAEFTDDFVRRGEVTVDQGKALAEDLLGKAKKKKDDMVDDFVGSLTEEQREKLRKAREKMERKYGN